MLAGLYLLVMGPTVDPLPFLDEGLALLVLLNSLAYLGLDFHWLFGGRRLRPVPVKVRRRDSD